MHINNMVPCQRSLTRDSGNFLQYAMICFKLFALKRLLFFMASTVIHLPSVSVWRLSSRSRTNLHFWMKSFCRARAGHACNVQWGFWNLYILECSLYESFKGAYPIYNYNTLKPYFFEHTCMFFDMNVLYLDALVGGPLNAKFGQTLEQSHFQGFAAFSTVFVLRDNCGVHVELPTGFLFTHAAASHT